MNVIEFNTVWKKFRRGERFSSLRDTIPNLLHGLLSKNNSNRIKKEEFWALKDVSFNVKKKDVLGIIGPNGAGKSTILKLLSQIMKPNKGEIKIEGRLSALIEVAAGFHNELTGRENIYLNGTILGMKRKEIDRKFDEVVEFSGLREFIDTPVKRYSSGMYSRLGFSVAAHMDPDILLVDEVLAVGDLAFQGKCAQKMWELLDSGTTIVLVSHNLLLVKNLCKRVILLDKGQIQKEGSPEEVIPYYENLVYEQKQKELKKRVSYSGYKVRVNENSLVEILDVLIYDGEYQGKNNLKVGRPISIKVDYEAKEKIKNPVFLLNIIRSDGVVCCSTNTKDDHFFIESIQGRGTINISLGKINLAPGIYLIKISIWDKDMIHPYTIRKKDIIKIESEEFNRYVNAVFLARATWSTNG